MGFRLTFPGTKKRAQNFDDRHEAVESALRAADEFEVELHELTGEDEADVLLVRYEKRPEPIFGPGGPLHVSPAADDDAGVAA